MASLTRYDIAFNTEVVTDDGTDSSEIEIKVVTEKTFVEVAQFAETMIGKERDEETIVSIRRVRMYSDVEVI
jgi:hypothetical protein